MRLSCRTSVQESQFLRNLITSLKYNAYFSMHSGEQQVFVPFVDTHSKATSRTRPTTELEVAMAAKMVDNSQGWFRNGGIAYKMNSYSADGTLCDWVAGVGKVDFAFTVEMWGGPYQEDCFMQFNPHPDKVLHIEDVHVYGACVCVCRVRVH